MKPYSQFGIQLIVIRPDAVHVRFGSRADIRNAKRHVRFTLESGHVQCTRPCPL